MVRPEDVLNAADYKNYRNVRAVSLLFVILGGVFFLAGLSGFGERQQQQQRQRQQEPLDPVLAIGLGLVGLVGAIGGVATRRGNRQFAPLVKVMAFLYLLAFPLGTILSLVLLTGLSRYLESVERIRRAETEGEDWNDEVEEGKPARPEAPWNKPRPERKEGDNPWNRDE